jgi:(E)-4-hydroxy-3-methylbut-2-enyl-diphosphate synthase
MEERKKTRPVKVGNVIVGGGFPVSVQTMWKKPLKEGGLPSIVDTLMRLSRMGCDIVRFAVPDEDSAELLGALSRMTDIPLVADIHFDHRLALRCLDFPVAKIRINPGNIGDDRKVREVISKAAGQGAALRIGVNEGSLPKALEKEKDAARAMIKAAEMEMETLSRLDFKDVVFSLKSSDIATMVIANSLFSKAYDFPLHIGVTEAGPLVTGTVKNAIGISELLKLGIGDTLRVSLTADPENEVLAGNEILRVLGRRNRGVSLVSCPRCGRASFDSEKFLESVSDFIHSIRTPLTIAIMGCIVNGPGEAKKADIGITGAGKYAIIFKNGEILKKVPYIEAVEEFKSEVLKLCAERG